MQKKSSLLSLVPLKSSSSYHLREIISLPVLFLVCLKGIQIVIYMREIVYNANSVPAFKKLKY